MAVPTNQDVDASLIDEAVRVVQDAKARAPQDYLFGLAVVLGTIALALLAAAALAQGVLQDLFLNLGAEVIGAWLTVVLIDGLWKRLEAGTSASLEDTSRRLEARKASALTDAERRAWRSFVDDYRALVDAHSPLDRIREIPRYGRRINELKVRANRTLDDHP